MVRSKRPVSRSPSPSGSPADGRKRKKKEKQVEEKRGARFLASPSKQVLDRIERAYKHRLYLVDKQPVSDTKCHFIIQGATGNVYTSTLGENPSCTCPDFGRCHTCKHLLFVMLRVLKLSRSDPRVWQKALLSTELKELLELQSADDSSIMASTLVRQKFNQLSGKPEQQQEPEKSIQRSIEGDCPVCYEPMAGEDGSPAEALVFCKTCGNNVHKDCFDRWSKSKSSYKVTCIYCRAAWIDDSAKPGSASASSDYINLASVSEHHNAENTSLEALYPDCHEWIGRRGRSRGC